MTTYYLYYLYDTAGNRKQGALHSFLLPCPCDLSCDWNDPKTGRSIQVKEKLTMTIRKIINFKIPLLVAILIIILFIAGWLWLTMPLDLLRDQRVVNTQRQLNRFSDILRRYAIKHETLPGPGLDDAIQSMMKDCLLYTSPSPRD